jgi:hypothetical protein
MGVICQCIENRERKKNHKVLNNIEQKTKFQITKIEAKIQLLENEIKDLYIQCKTDNGNITKTKKKEIKEDLFEKVNKCKKLYAIRRNLKSNLGEIDDIKVDNEFDEIVKDINQAINNNIVDHENIDTNIEILNNRKNMSDIKYQKLEEGQNILDGRKNQFEKDAIINDFIVSH